jgi:hypothetical protein
VISYTTFVDVVNHGFDYLGGNPTDQARRDCIRAALEAYRDLANAFNWSYLYTHGRVITSGAFDGSQNNATIQYQASGGTYDFQVTLSGAIWPDWAAQGTYLRCAVDDPNLNNNGPGSFVDDTTTAMVAFRVAERKSATVLTLNPEIAPAFDLPAGTEFVLYRDTYLLPEDYTAQDQALYERNFGGMRFKHPREWLYENRYVFAQGIPEFYTITGDAQYPGRMVIRLFPWPYQTKTIDFIYKRRPRRLLLQSYAAGTVAGTAGGTTLTGTGTTFAPAMVGSVVRLGADGTAKPPTSLIMGAPPAFETVITDWVSATSVNVQDPLDQTYTAAPLVVSDMIDVEAGAMLNAYLRCVEKHLGMARTLKDKPSAARQYLEALAEAKSADSRSFAGRSVNDHRGQRIRLRDMPIDLSKTY